MTDFPIRTAIPRRPIRLACPEDSRTKQAPKQACDINFIISRYQRTGVIDHFNRYGGEYGFAPSADFKEALELVERGNALFKALPSNLRAQFNHDPAAFLAYVQDPETHAERVKLGLAPATPPEAPTSP